MTKEEKILQAEERISFTKTRMILDMPFFGIIMSKLNTKPDFNAVTMGIDGKNLIYSPDFILKNDTSDDLLLFIFLHETFHIILNHLERRDGRDESLWNVACDYVVNGHIMELPNSIMFEEIIEECFWNRNYNNKLAEEVYELLKTKDSDRFDENEDNSDEDNDDESGTKGNNDSENQENKDNEENQENEDSEDNQENEEDQENKDDEENSDDSESNNEDEQQEDDNDSWENEEGAGSGSNGGISGGNDENNQDQNDENDNGSENGSSSGKNKDSNNKNSGNGEKSKEKEDNSQSSVGNQSGMASSHSNWSDIDDSKESMSEKFISIRHAYEMTKTHGSTPSFVIDVINEFFDPKEDWRVLLANFVEPLYPDYTFAPPSDMYPTFDFIMPEERPVEDGILDVYFYIDSSGSVPRQLLIEMASELKGCYEQFGDKSIIYYGDWSVIASEPKELEEVEDIYFEMSGGTDPSCIFHKLKELDRLYEARAIIILTDGYFNPISPMLAEGVQVLWLVSENGTKQNLTEWENVVEVSKEDYK